MENARISYKELLSSYKELKKIDATFEGCKNQIINKANFAKQSSLPFVDSTIIWWSLQSEEGLESILNAIDKRLRKSKAGSYNVFYSLQGLYSIEKVVPATFLMELKELHREFKKNKSSFDFSKLPTANMLATAITEAKAKESVAKKRIENANK